MNQLHIENDEIYLDFDCHLMRGLISVKGSRERYSMDLAANAWVRLTDAGAASVFADDKLPRIPLGRPALQRAYTVGQAIHFEFLIQGLLVAALIRLQSGGFMECRLHPAGDRRRVLLDGVFPGMLRRPDAFAYTVAFARGQGVLFYPGETAYAYSTPAVGQGMTMRWFGGIGRASAYICIADQPEDSVFELHYKPRREFEAGIRWIASRGALRYPRRLLYGFFIEPSYVLMARRFRKYAARKGLLVTLREKSDACQSLDRLHGGVLLMLGYFDDPRADYLGVLRKIRSMGISRALVYPARMDGLFTARGLEPFINLPARDLRGLHNLGYLAGAFFCPCDIHAAHPDLEKLAARCDPDPGNPRAESWRLGRNVYYRAHFGKVRDLLGSRFNFNGLDAVHFDVLANAAGRHEDYSPDWPLSRREHAAAAVELARYYRDRGKIVSSEGKTDRLAAVLHWGTFRLRVAPQYRRNDSGPDCLRPAPLWHLVFHDVMFHSSWEHATYNDGCGNGAGNPAVGRLHDLLYGDMPSVFPVGRLYRFTGGGFRYYSIRPDSSSVQRALELARQAAEHHREVGMLQMTSHRFVDGHPLFQESVFENGRRVLANFSSETMRVDRQTVPGKSAALL